MGMAARKRLPENEFVNIAELIRRFRLDRATINKRIREARIMPAESRAKETIYELTLELVEVLQQTNESFEAAKLRELVAKANLAEFKSKQAEGELVPMNDVIERVQTIFMAVYKEFALHQPKRLAKRLVKAKTVAEVHKLIKLDTERVFGKLRENDAAMVPQTK